MDTLRMPAEWVNRPIRVALIGCGGTGSEMFDELFRMHTLMLALGGDGLHVTAYDPDVVSTANIGRQRFWPADVGYPKAEVLVNRINNFGGSHWEFVDEAFSEHVFTNDRISYDLLITCVDVPEVRAMIGHHAQDDNNFGVEQLWLDCGNDSNSGNVILGHFNVSHGQKNMRIPNVFDLYPVLGDMEGSDQPSCSTAEALQRQDYGINRAVAREGASLLWQLFRHGALSRHGSYIDLQAGSVIPLLIDKEIWKSYH